MLLDVIDVHLDGLNVAKEMVVEDIDGIEMLEAVAAVDEAIALTEKVKGRVERGI